jgi:hypothetical protein
MYYSYEFTHVYSCERPNHLVVFEIVGIIVRKCRNISVIAV